MKLRNKKTGEIVSLQGELTYDDKVRLLTHYGSLAELNEEWEDYPTEEVWYLGKKIGNYSMPKKEARKATEKILAWKRLKDKGFRFTCWDGYVSAGDFDSGDHFECCGFVNVHGNFDSCEDDYSKYKKDLDLLFGGEE